MKKLILLLLFIPLFFSCTKDPVIYTLTTTANPADGGTVSPSSKEYNEGETATINATPAAEYVFDKWTGATGTEETTIVMDSDKTVVANFIKKKWEVVMDKSPFNGYLSLPNGICATNDDNAVYITGLFNTNNTRGVLEKKNGLFNYIYGGNPSTTINPQNITISSNGTFYIADPGNGTGSKLYKKQTSESNWSIINIPKEDGLNDVHVTGDNTIYITYISGFVYKKSPNDSEWTALCLNNDICNAPTSIFVSSDNTLYVANLGGGNTGEGYVMKKSPNDSNWSVIYNHNYNSGGSIGPIAVSVDSNNTVYIANQGAKMSIIKKSTEDSEWLIVIENELSLGSLELKIQSVSDIHLTSNKLYAVIGFNNGDKRVLKTSK
ncbi:hypothetical protein OAM29_03500 [Flavobacteriaceae bacterium]|nr:hypothetical protein [Flavobacteriaceae bacterium]